MANKRGQGEGTISKREDGTWWARITVGKDESGKQKRKAFYGKTRKEVQEKLTEALNEINKGGYVEPSKLTVSMWMDTWAQEYKKRSVKATTYYRICGLMEVHIKPLLGQYKLTELRGDMIQKFINTLTDIKHLKPKSVDKIHLYLKAALEQAVQNGLIAKNPATNTIRPQLVQSEKVVLTPEHQKQFVECAKNSDFGEFFIMALGTGLRLGELLALTWDDINFDDCVLRVSKGRSQVKDYYDKQANEAIIYTTPKTKSSNRTVPLIPDIVKLLRTIQEKQTYIKSQIGDAYEGNLIFCDYDGKPISMTSLRRRFATIRDAVGADGLTIHGLRHTFATLMYDIKKNPCKIKVFQRQKQSSMPKVCLLRFFPVKVIKDTSKNKILECLLYC